MTAPSATEGLRLEISDDRRTTVATERDTELLATLRERAALYSGDVDAGRRPDGDYAVQARLPLRSSP